MASLAITTAMITSVVVFVVTAAPVLRLPVPCSAPFSGPLVGLLGRYGGACGPGGLRGRACGLGGLQGNEWGSSQAQDRGAFIATIRVPEATWDPAPSELLLVNPANQWARCIRGSW